MLNEIRSTSSFPFSICGKYHYLSRLASSWDLCSWSLFIKERKMILHLSLNFFIACNAPSSITLASLNTGWQKQDAAEWLESAAPLIPLLIFLHGSSQTEAIWPWNKVGVQVNTTWNNFLPFNDKFSWCSNSFGFPGGSVEKNPPTNAGDTEDMALILGWGRSPGEGNGNLIQYSCLRNPMDRGTWWVTVHEVAKSLRKLSTHTQFFWNYKLKLGDIISHIHVQEKLVVFTFPYLAKGGDARGTHVQWSWGKICYNDSRSSFKIIY